MLGAPQKSQNSPRYSKSGESTPARKRARGGVGTSEDSSPPSSEKGKEKEISEDSEKEVATQAPTESQLAYFEERNDDTLQTLDEVTEEYELDLGGSSTFKDEDLGKEEELPKEVLSSKVRKQAESVSVHSEEREPSLSSSDAEEQEKSDKPSNPELSIDSKEMATVDIERPKKDFGLAKRTKVSGKGTGKGKRKLVNGNNDEVVSDIPENMKKSPIKRSRISNKRRAALRSNQHVSIDRVKQALGYGDVHMAEGVREAISDSMNFFATKVLIQAKELINNSGRERMLENYMSSALDIVVPFSPVSTRIATNVENTLDTWNQYLSTMGVPEIGDEGEVPENGNGKKNVRVEKACQLNVSISSLKNLAVQVIPTIGGLRNNPAFITLGAAVETMTEAVIHRAVGAMISTSILKKTGTLTLTKEHVNVALHYMTNTDQIRSYSSDKVYVHRKVEYEKALEKAIEENAKRAPGFRSKKIALKHKVKERVAQINERGLLTPIEVTSFLIHDNTIPLVFSGLKLMDTSTIVNIRHGALPTERMQRKYNTLVTGECIVQADKTMLKTLGVLRDNISKTEEAQLWFAHNRE